MSESGPVKFITIQSTRLNTTTQLNITSMIHVFKSEVWAYT